MKYTFEYPSEAPDASPEFLEPSVMLELAAQADRLGYAAIALSDHPAPSAKWRHAGGHDTLDPAVALAFMAAATTSIQLMTHLYVLPFRNPYISAKALASVDIVSGGRLIAGVGAGYLRSEFAAVGVDFERRAELFDAHLDALVDIWTAPSTPRSGPGYAGHGEMWLHAPTQAPHPPIWIGGNSRAALRRVVTRGTGWCPVIAPAGVAASLRTRAIDGPESFASGVGELRTLLAAHDRDPGSVSVQVRVPETELDDASAVSSMLATIAEYEAAGATHAVVHTPASSRRAASDYLAQFADIAISTTTNA